MKIGIVTFWKNNYGSVLQAYATKKYLESKGFEVDILNERYRGLQKYTHYLSKNVELFFNILRYKNSVKYYYRLKKINQNKSFLTNTASNKINQFIKRHLSPYECSYHDLKEYANNTETVAIIAGSDQIWNCSKGVVNPYYFLGFVPSNKRIALSASFGTNRIPSFLQNSVSKYLQEFSALSVRECEGQDIVNKLIGTTPPRLADPTILLSGEEWREFAKKYEPNYKNYVFIHFIDEPNEVAKKEIKRISKLKKIVCFSYNHKSLSGLKNIIFINGTPEEYVSYIDNAEFVLTDSFHTCMFSINLDTQFYVFERQYKQIMDQNSRIKTLLKLFDCEDRYIISENQTLYLNEMISYKKKRIINDEKSQLESFLLGSIMCDNIDNMKTMLKTHKNCTGCGACISACQFNAIKMSTNEYGFEYPVIDTNKCRKCGNCSRVCSFNINIAKDGFKNAYVLYNSDYELRNISASGGVFSAIATKMILEGGVVYGAQLSIHDTEVVVEHIEVDKLSDLNKVLGSKYVQSSCYKVFPKIKKQIKNGKKVLFGGTSCQVSALYKYLSNVQNLSNLLTIDLICHGVPSQKFFQDYITYISKKHRASIEGFSFRRKENNIINYTETIQLKRKEKKICISISSDKSSYYKLFLLGESYRESCYHCEFASINKPADITIGDYFELSQDYPSIYNAIISKKGCGVSCAIANTEKGKSVIESMNNELVKFVVDIDIVQASHSQLCAPMKHTVLREKIFEKYRKNGYSSVARYFSQQNFILAIPRYIKYKIIKRR